MSQGTLDVSVYFVPTCLKGRVTDITSTHVYTNMFCDSSVIFFFNVGAMHFIY